MKILQINAIYGGGSTGRTTAELDKGLMERGISSIVAVSKSNIKRDNIYIIGNKLDWKIHAFLSRLWGKQGYFSKRATKGLIKYIEKKKPDVIHLRNLHANYINVPLLLQYIIKNNIPTVITLHDCWTFTGKCCYYTDDCCERWKDHCGKCPALKKWNSSWFFDFSKKMLEEKKAYFSSIKRLAVIGVSDWITNEARQSILGNAWKVKRIYNWIDLSTFHPIEDNILRKEFGHEERFVILGVSQTWSVEKGILIFRELAEKCPDDMFVLVGNLPEQYEMPENVISAGAVSDVHTLAKFYSMADVLLNPSVQETFGKTTAEAISCGTPVIGYNVTATPELIGENCGAIVEASGNIGDIIHAIDVVKKNTKKHYSKYCVDFAKENFSKEKLIDEYVSLYKEMVQ